MCGHRTISHSRLVRFSFNFHIHFLMICSFPQSFLEPFDPGLQPPACAAVPMKSLWHSLHNFCLSSPRTKLIFYFISTCTIGYFLFFGTTCLPRTALFHYRTPAIFFLRNFSSGGLLFKAIYTFTHIPIEILFEKNDFITTSKVPFSCYFVIKKTFSVSSFLFCGPHAQTILITSFPDVSTIAIILSLFLLTSTTFLDYFYFTKIPTPPDPALFPDHQSLYLGP